MKAKAELHAVLKRVMNTIFGRNNLLGTDFTRISATEIAHEDIDDEFAQTSGGAVLITFAISNHALEKLRWDGDDLKRLLDTSSSE